MAKNIHLVQQFCYSWKVPKSAQRLTSTLNKEVNFVYLGQVSTRFKVCVFLQQLDVKKKVSLSLFQIYTSNLTHKGKNCFDKFKLGFKIKEFNFNLFKSSNKPFTIN